MELLNRLRLRTWQIILPVLALILIFGVACGSAAAPAEESLPAAETAPQQPPAQPAAEAAPTAVPQAAVQPEEAGMVQVHPGNVTFMVAAWGDERFDRTFSGGASNSYGRILHGFLIESTAETELIPGIASEWGFSEDGLTWIVTVRDGVKFHDGTDLTAKDVAWSIEHNFGPQAAEYAQSSTAVGFAKKMAKVEQTGPNEVSSTFKSIETGFPGYMSAAGPTWPAIYPARATLRNEEEEAAYDKNPIGAGVMKRGRFVPSEVIEFERYDDYYFQPASGFDEDRTVKFATLDLRLVPEEATRVAAIRAGDADVAPVSLRARPQVEKGGGRIVWGAEGGYFRIMLFGCWTGAERAGMETYPCMDKRVRHALSYAVDKELMRDRLYGGPEAMEVERGGWGAVTPSTIGYSADLKPFPFDPAKARALLTEAGYKNPDNPNGKDFGPLVVNTWVSALMPFLPESAQLAAENWKRELGIETEVVVGEEVSMKDAYKAGNLDGQIVWRDNETRLDAASIMGSHFGRRDKRDRGHNDPVLFEAVEEAISVFADAERPAALNKLYRQLYEEQYLIGIGTINIPWALGPDVADWQPFPVAFYPSSMHTLILKEE